ncbi:MAG: hypothetical protein AABZ53_13265 [Planctomycetota bacterium]
MMIAVFLILGIVCFVLGTGLVLGCQALMPPPPRRIEEVPKNSRPSQHLGGVS